MNPHRDGMDFLLGIDERTEDMRLALANALAELRKSRPANGAEAASNAAVRRQITETLRRAA